MSQNASDTKKVAMSLVSTKSDAGQFVFDLCARSHTARVVSFEIDQVDAVAMYEALDKFLHPSKK